MIRLVDINVLSPNLWTDAWLAALADAAGAGLTSFDSGFSKFELRKFELLA